MLPCLQNEIRGSKVCCEIIDFANVFIIIEQDCKYIIIVNIHTTFETGHRFFVGLYKYRCIQCFNSYFFLRIMQKLTLMKILFSVKRRTDE